MEQEHDMTRYVVIANGVEFEQPSAAKAKAVAWVLARNPRNRTVTAWAGETLLWSNWECDR